MLFDPGRSRLMRNVSGLESRAWRLRSGCSRRLSSYGCNRGATRPVTEGLAVSGRKSATANARCRKCRQNRLQRRCIPAMSSTSVLGQQSVKGNLLPADAVIPSRVDDRPLLRRDHPCAGVRARVASSGLLALGPEQRSDCLLAEPFLGARIAPAIVIMQREQSRIAEIEPQHVQRVVGVLFLP